jgi:hypothetical protein
MSNNNNAEVNGMIFAMAIVGVVLAYAAIFIGIILAGLCVFATGVAIWAWNKPRMFFGQIITPGEARAFVASGIAGAFAAPLVVSVIADMADIFISADYAWLVLLGGYTIGCLLCAWVQHLMEQNQKANEEVLAARAIPVAPPSQPKVEKPQAQQPFEFATWDDEEAC